MISNAVPLLLSQNHLTVLLLSAIKVDLVNDFAGALIRYQIAPQVAHIILSMDSSEIQMLADLSGRQNLLRLANSSSPAFWADLKQALVNGDRTGVNMSLVQSLLSGVPAAL